MTPMPTSTPPVPKPYAERALGEDTVALLRDGEQAYPAMLAAIARAERTICFETYILRDDTTGKRFLEALMDRASAGVSVLLLFDAWGSRVSAATIEALEAAGVTVRAFRPWRLAGSLARSLARHRRRNHRKSLIIDARIAFTGGMNVSDDYAAVADGGEGWRDTNLRIEGPSAHVLEQLFLETWRRNRGPKLDPTRFGREPLPQSRSLRIVGNGFVRDSKRVRRAYLEAFAGARERIFLTNAYFLPPANVVGELVAASRRGVRVAVILAATTDVKLVLYAARALYPILLRGGVELYEWSDERVLHAKTAVVDGRWTTVGSTNLDPLSLMQNLEVNAIVVDHVFGASAEQLFLEDLTRCRRITFDDLRRYGLFERALSWLAWRLRLWL